MSVFEGLVAFKRGGSEVLGFVAQAPQAMESKVTDGHHANESTSPLGTVF